MACLLSWRILKDGTSMALRWLRQLAMAFVLSNVGAQLLWVCAMDMYPQQHDDFGWLDHATWREEEMPLFIKADLSLFTKTAMAIPQVEFVMQIAAHERHC